MYHTLSDFQSDTPLKRGIKAKFPFYEGVDAAFYAAAGVVGSIPLL